MKPRALAVAVLVAALAIPAAADARVLAPKHPAKPAKHVVKQRVVVAPRVLCICVTGPVPVIDPQTQAATEAQYDQDLVAHGLDPVYGTTTVTTAVASTTTG
jgi:hypothetical protein